MILIFGKIYSNINAVLDNKLLAGKKNITEQNSMHDISGASAIHAISAARAGSRVSMIGTVGNDLFGKHCLEIFRRDGINCSGIAKSNTGTGIAFSFTDPSNETTYVTSIGANIHSHSGQIDKNSINNRCLLILSNDIGEQEIRTLLNLSKERNARSVLCFSSDIDIEIDKDIYSLADIIITDKIMVEHNYNYIVKTKNLGINGATLLDKKGNIYGYSPNYESNILDASSCFDIFCGFFASAIQAGIPIKRAIAFATKAAQKSSETRGGYNSVPYLGYIQNIEEEKLLES